MFNNRQINKCIVRYYSSTTQSIKGTKTNGTKQLPKGNVNVMNQQNKTTLIGGFKSTAKISNEIIAIVAQNPLDSVKLGSIKSIIQQIESVERKLHDLKLKLQSSIISKKPIRETVEGVSDIKED